MKKNPTLNAVSNTLKKEVDLLVIAGEHSGDELASDLISELRTNKPDLSIVSIGGNQMEKLRVPLLFNLVDHSVFGFIDVLKNYAFFKQLLENCLEWIHLYQPKNICFIDYPGFNLRLAKALYQKGLSLKAGGRIKLFYYVSPQIWAWKRERRFIMEKYIDALATLLPFEKKHYEDTALPVTYVGHPFAKSNYPLKIQYHSQGPILLLPGSREGSVKKLCPILLDTFKKLKEVDPKLSACIVYPSELIRTTVENILDHYPELVDSVCLIKNDFKQLNCRMTIMSSGTMSLTVALSAIPGIVIYSLSSLNYWILKFLVRVPYISLANLILGRELYVELIQKQANTNNILTHLKPLLSDSKSEVNFRVASNEIKKALYEDREMGVADWLRSEMQA